MQEAKNVNLTNIKIYKAFDILKQELIENEFAFDLWKDLKIKDKNVHIQNKKRHAKPTGAGDVYSSDGSGRQVKSVPASDVEKLAQAFKISLRRLYSFGIIDFDDTNACEVTVKDEAAFKEQISLVGFKSVNSYKEVLHKLGRTAYILTINLN